MNTQKFIDLIGDTIKRVALERGYKYPSSVIAQAVVESGNGNSLLAIKYHNYFGLKCGSSWNGKSINMQTKEEYTTGTLTTIRDNFRVYDDMKSGVKGYFDFINYSRYSNLKSATSSRDYIVRIKNDGYSTSSTYVNTVYKIVKQYDLEKRYDNMTNEMSETKIIDKLARDVINGKYGSGAERKNKLGLLYNSVQKKVNEIL